MIFLPDTPFGRVFPARQHFGRLTLPQLDLSGMMIIGIFGQSNVNGEAFVSNMSLTDSDFSLQYPNAFQFERLAILSGDPITYSEGIRGPVALSPRNLSGTLAGGDFGLEASMLRYLDHSRPANVRGFIVVKLGIGGSVMTTNWNTSGSVYPTAGGRLVQQWVNYLQTVSSSSRSPVSLLVFEHGTSDALVVASASYQQNLTNLFNFVHPFFPTVPWIIAQINPNLNASAASISGTIVVRAAQATFVSGTSNTFLVDMQTPELFIAAPTTPHYNADGYYALGRKVAQTALTALPVSSVPFADFLYSNSGTTVFFTGTSVALPDTIASQRWNFGDANTSTSTSPTNAYVAPGLYSVRLDVTGTNGNTDSITRRVIVSNTAWTIDATSLKACPVSLAESVAFHTAALLPSPTSGPPSSIWTFQDAGPLSASDSIGGITLTATNAFTFHSVETGWSRFGIRFADGVANRNLTNSTTVADASRESTLLFAYIVMPPTTPALVRGLFGIGGAPGPSDIRVSNIGGHLRSASSANTDILNSITGTAQPVYVQNNLAKSISTIYTEQERYILPWRKNSTSNVVWFGGFTATGCSCSFLYGGLYTGSAAEKSVSEVRSIMRYSGWNPKW